MATELIVNGTTFNYPENREEAGWGEEATAWAVAVTAVLDSLVGSGDILQTTSTIANSGTLVNITGFSFDPTVVRGAICEYSIYRKTDTAADERLEVGLIYLGYKTQDGSWELTGPTGGGTSGITLTITAAGQMQYTVTEPLEGANYVGTIKFKARALAI